MPVCHGCVSRAQPVEVLMGAARLCATAVSAVRNPSRSSWVPHGCVPRLCQPCATRRGLHGCCTAVCHGCVSRAQPVEVFMGAARLTQPWHTIADPCGIRQYCDGL